MIAERLHQIARRDPRAVALVSNDYSMTCAELLAAGAQVRRRLEALRARPGDVVAVSLPVRWETAACFVACASMGAIFAPVHQGWREAELRWLIARVAPAAVVVLSSDVERWTSAGIDPERLLFADQFPRPDTNTIEAPQHRLPASHPVVYLISSGSTGKPKIVQRTQSAVLSAADAGAGACSIGPGHQLLATMPANNGCGFTSNLVLPLLTGATTVTLENFEPGAAAALIERFAVGYLITSPVVYALFSDAKVPASALASLRVCLSAGAPLGRAIREEWARRGIAPIRQLYGSSEASLISLQSEDSPSSECVGPPVPGVEILVLSENVPQSAGRVGEILVRCGGLMTGYVGEPEETAARFWNGYLRTGDLGSLDENGQIYLAGRIRPWINMGGIKVDPIEVRRALQLMPQIRDCVVEAAPGPRGMDVVSATIVSEPGAELTRAQIVQHCRKHLTDSKIPRIVNFVADLGTELTGKIPKKWI